MRIRTLYFPLLVLAAACDRTPFPTEAGSPDLEAAKGGGKPKWIAFDSDRSYPTRQIWRVKPDASGLEQLTSLGENFHPSFSPDGRKIVFSSSRDGGYGHLYVMNADGGNQRGLTNSNASDYNPDWSPDGTRIVFVSDESGSRDLWRVNPDGADRYPYAGFVDSQEAFPRWSPDGKYVAFLSDKFTPGTYNVWVINTTSGVYTQITFPGVQLQPLAWTPDSKQVAFVYDVGSGQNVYGIDVVTLQSTILMSSSYVNAPLDFGIAFSADGTRIIYVGKGVGATFVGNARLDGTDRKTLVMSPHYYANPVWAR